MHWPVAGPLSSVCSVFACFHCSSCPGNWLHPLQVWSAPALSLVHVQRRAAFLYHAWSSSLHECAVCARLLPSLGVFARLAAQLLDSGSGFLPAWLSLVKAPLSRPVWVPHSLCLARSWDCRPARLHDRQCCTHVVSGPAIRLLHDVPCTDFGQHARYGPYATPVFG